MVDKKSRTIIVSDIHGCIEEFDELLKLLSYNSNSDRLILLGDLIDRGPDSVGVVRKASEMNLECVMGNHEAKYLKWFKSNKSVLDKQKFYFDFIDSDIDYIGRMPLYIKIDNTIIVHAGLKPGISISNQKKDDLLYLRYTDINGNFISLKQILKYGKKKMNAHFWTEFWKGPESVIYGHNVHSYIDPLIEKVSAEATCYGIDTGCCFGGNLSGIILETKEVVQVKAKQIYVNPKVIE
jgi:bis(5'-nucleosyl)-tetraphosphatase (symmetrical)